MFIRVSCTRCLSRDVMHFRHNATRLDQFCKCGKNLTAPQIRKQVKTRRLSLKTRSGRTKPMKSTKAINVGFALVLWAIITFASLPFAYAVTGDEAWGKEQTLNSIYEQALEIKRQLLVLKIDQAIGVNHSALVTMYNSLPEQTDDTPFITASGQRTRVGIVANNCLPFGSRVIIQDKTYEVQDRMNSRYDCNHYDLFSESYAEARKFGAQRLEVTKIVEP